MQVSNSTKRNRKKRTTILRIVDLHYFAISGAAFNAICDAELFPDSARPDIRPLTLRRIAQQQELPMQLRGHVTLDMGLWERIERLLAWFGWKPVVRPMPGSEHLYRINEPRPATEYENQPEALRRAAGRACTLAVVPSWRERICIVKELRESQPEAHLLIVVKNNQAARSLATEFQSLMEPPVSWGGGDRGFPWTHVLNSTAFTGTSTMDWRYVVFWDAELALSRIVVEQLRAMWRTRRIAFLGRDERQLLGPDRAIIEQMFGPVVYRPGDTSEDPAIGVVWLRQVGHSHRQFRDQLTQKRVHLWQCTARNQRIAQVALAFCQHDKRLLRQLGLERASRWLKGSKSNGPNDVAVIAENVEHAQALAQHLPGWRVASHAASARECPTIVGPQSIVTLTHADRALLAADVVVYGAGYGRRWLDSLGLVWSSAIDQRLLVIDVEDAYDSRIVSEGTSRALDYVRRRWQLLGMV